MRLNHAGVALGAAALFGAGALTTYLLAPKMGKEPPTRVAPSSSTANAAVPGARGAGSVVVRIAPELVIRAGIRVQTVEEGNATGGLRVPGTVQANAYSKVSVTPLAAGRVTRVPVELGQHVARGATLAEIYSPDLAEARTRYVTMKADLEAGEARIARTERLAQIGAASQQELEQAKAEHTRHQTDVEQAAARLRLLGVDPAHVTHDGGDERSAATVRVTAPQEGVVLERPATVGMSAESSTVLVTLVQLSPVWVIANVYDRDLGSLVAGAAATVTTEAYPDVSFPGRVTYISPEVRAETRTAEARVEVPNPRGRLRLGMFVTVAIDGIRRPSAAVIARSAVQTVGSHSVVYLVIDEAAGRFEERSVTLGEQEQNRVAVASGLVPGDRVVTEGSFALRAEVERQGLRQASPSPEEPTAKRPAPVQVLTVLVTAAGFEPSSLTLRAGAPARITFTRTTDETCAKEVVFPDYAIRRALPLNQPVTVEFTPKKDASGFVCGMNMLKGTLVVQ